MNVRICVFFLIIIIIIKSEERIINHCLWLILEQWYTALYVLYNVLMPQHGLAPYVTALQWCHNQCDGASNHRRLDGFCSNVCSGADQRKHQSPASWGFDGEMNSPVSDEFAPQRASNVENVSIWWRHHHQATSRQGSDQVHVQYLSTSTHCPCV